MTDKQIIDVSKCKECGLRNCEGTLIYWCHTYDDHCKDFDNCYYKQLKRKATVKQYNVILAKNDNLITITRRYSDLLENRIHELENENLLLKEKIKALESTASK